MNHHTLLDETAVRAAALAVGRHRFFAESVAGPTVLEAVASARADVDGLERNGVRTVAVETPAGTLEAAYLVYQWLGPDHPTVIYNHGSNERPFDLGRLARHTFKDVFVVDQGVVPANVAVVRAPFHDGSVRDYAKRLARLENFTSMLAASVSVTEALRAALSGPVVVAGFSLGGWVTNLHRIEYGSADGYAPMFAGAALDDLFTESAYRVMVGEAGRDNPEALEATLNFEDALRDADAGHLAALLGRHDRYVRFAVQREAYDPGDLAVCDAGHITGALASDRLRSHVRGVVDAAR